ncbi:hypothetical protein RFI_12574, partial [Reticulomyxa filosa]
TYRPKILDNYEWMDTIEGTEPFVNDVLFYLLCQLLQEEENDTVEPSSRFWMKKLDFVSHLAQVFCVTETSDLKKGLLLRFSLAVIHILIEFPLLLSELLSEINEKKHGANNGQCRSACWYVHILFYIFDHFSSFLIKSESILLNARQHPTAFILHSNFQLPLLRLTPWPDTTVFLPVDVLIAILHVIASINDKHTMPEETLHRLVQIFFAAPIPLLSHEAFDIDSIFNLPFAVSLCLGGVY